MKLSILVPTVPNRLETFYPRIMKVLLEQTKNTGSVEILGFFDNKKRTVGEKRQNLLDLAKGEYLVFIDDDDRISEDYVDSILQAIKENPNCDCIVFDCICKIENGPETYCKYGIEYEYKTVGQNWYGKPAHTMVYKSSIAKKHRYINSNYGEDMDWVKKAWKDIKNQVRIEKVLYYYDCKNKTTSETRGLSDDHIKEHMKKVSKSITI